MSPEAQEEFLLRGLVYLRYRGATLKELLDLRPLRAYGEPPHYGVQPQTPSELAEVVAALHRLESARIIREVEEHWFLTDKDFKTAKGPAAEPEWTWSDAWILRAVLSSESLKKPGLGTVMACATGWMDKPPSWLELYTAVNRLHAGKLIDWKRGQARPTKKALELESKVERCWKKPILDQIEGLHRLLACPCCGARSRAVRWKVPLDRATWEEANKAGLRVLGIQ
jgi:hypothetical protein